MSRASLPRTMTPETAQAMAAWFLARRRAMHGDATMTAPTGEQQQTGQEGQQQTGQQGSQQTAETGGGQQASGQQQAAKDDGPKFTQADLDRYIAEVTGRERAKHEKQLKDAQELAGKNETEKLTIERDQATQRAQEATAKAAERIAKTEAKVAAIAAGARPDRLDAIIRTADLAGAVKDGEVDEAAVKTAVEKVLADYSEWKAAPGGPSASGGELNGAGGGGKPTFTRKQLEDMPPQEMADRIDEINDAFADGRVTG